MSQFFGKYRGKVENNVDPMTMGRLQVSAPAVLGDGITSWAMPCVPYAGSSVGLYAMPPVGANVWVEFEAGDPDYPVWSGCFWGSGELSGLNATVPTIKVFKTDGITLTMSDVSGSGGVKLEVGSPGVSSTLKMVLDSGGIELSNGSSTVKLSSSSVSVNNGALEVT